MKNLFNSPFEYWEKIGYVGYNNYTDLHLKIKKNILFQEWGNLKKESFMEHKIMFTQYLHELNYEIKKNNLNSTLIFSKNKIKNTKKFKFFCIFNSLMHLFKKTYVLQLSYLKILKFLNIFKKKNFKKIISFFSNKKYTFLLKKYIFYINKIYQLYFKVLFFNLKKTIIILKKKFYRYLKFFFQYSFLLSKKQPLYKLSKNIIKNIYLLYKNPLLLKQYNKILTLSANVPLYNNSVIKNNYLNNLNYSNKSIFESIPQSSNKQKKIFKLFICNYFNINLSQLKYIVNKYNFVKWEDFFVFLNNNLSYHLKTLDLNNYLINNIALNGNQVILHKHSNISLFTGDFLEINIQNTNDLLKWLNNKLFLFFFLVGNYNSSFMCKQLLRYFIVITYNFISNK